MSDLERVVARLEAAVVAVDATLRVTIWNDAARRLLGFDAGEALGRSFTSLLSLDATSARGVAAMAALRREGRWSGEATARDRSGAERKIALDASSLAAPDEPWRGAVVALRDAARRDEERRQVAASQRLAAVARIAGGAAHDLNNVLQSVVSCADVLRAQLPADDPRRSWMERIRGAARRGGALTGRLMAFAREGTHATEQVDVNVVAAECVELFRPILEPGIRVALELDPRAGFVFVEQSALTQALANLVLNARDAMPQGGTLTIGTSRRDGGVAERNGRRLALGAGPHVELFVADTGEGIPPEAQERIFEPLFTTKANGTGLGLPSVLATARDAGGDVAVASSPGGGSRFSLVLPESRLRLAPPPDETAAIPDAAPRAWRVLIVAAERATGEALAAGLAAWGCTADAVAGPQDALRLLAGGPVDAMVVDALLPGMCGPDLAEAFLAARPDGIVVLMAGPGDMDLVLQSGGLPRVSCLRKPFGLERVQRALCAAAAERR